MRSLMQFLGDSKQRDICYVVASDRWLSAVASIGLQCCVPEAIAEKIN
jgi:hypothetical protein